MVFFSQGPPTCKIEGFGQRKEKQEFLENRRKNLSNDILHNENGGQKLKAIKKIKKKGFTKLKRNAQYVIFRLKVVFWASLLNELYKSNLIWCERPELS